MCGLPDLSDAEEEVMPCSALYLCCVCPSRGRVSALPDPVLHASAAPLRLWERLLFVRPDALLGQSRSLLFVRPDALLGQCCGWGGPGLEAAGVTCTLSCAVPCLMLISSVLWCSSCASMNITLSFLSWNVRGFGQTSRCMRRCSLWTALRPTVP